MKKRWIAVILSATLVFSNSGMVLAQENSQGLNNGNESYSESADLYDQAIDSELEIYSSDEVPDYDLWMADTMLYGMFGDGDGLYSTFESFQDPVYKQLGGYLLDDTSLVTISAAWSVYFNNTYRSQFADEQKYIYETLLMSYLTYEADEDSGHSIETELLDDVSKFSADLYQAAAEELSENPVYYIRNLTVDEAETFLKNLSTIENISTAIDYINDASDAVQSADDLINAVSEYMALQQVKEERIALIQSARDACAAMSTPNQGFIDACDEITEMLENLDVGYFFGETVLTNLWSKAIEKGWDALCDANVILKTVDLSVSGLNILFDTTDSASNNLKLALLYTMDCYMQMGMMTAAADYMNDWTDTAAAVNYLSCFRGYLEFQMFGNDFAVTWLEDYLDR
ncbi:MAG: hypothetical protein LIP11_09175 [Clostridiales bacterium]|nr:hypothetical protein [Clostridiales bacterium]